LNTVNCRIKKLLFIWKAAAILCRKDHCLAATAMYFGLFPYAFRGRKEQTMAEQASIADSSKPSAGRIYDFFLGGNHNFEVDRQAAQQLLNIVPFAPQSAKLVRWFLGEAVRRLAADGFTHFIDIASGLPTVDHIHQITPAGTKVIYSDCDPVTVAYGQEILKDNPNARYIMCNAEKPEDLLNSTVVSELFRNNRRVAIGFNGIAYFLKDDDIEHAMKVLYDWADTGSRIFICDTGRESATVPPVLQELFKTYEKLGQPMSYRSLDTHD
jgi:hypothetical protein